ncbi:acanthoscurrin-2-like [Stegodyphus dumicola]|uniref:acanthoscurrin-2-like n=1 Tax=Stegodyphus dumicola TaxID=202533 RepID=UPI0015AEC0F8|nr:acanthoscurrin-2-like [Stegodyphus dumicola]
MLSALCLVFLLGASLFVSTSEAVGIGEIGGGALGGHGIGASGLAGGDRAGSGYGGHKGGVSSKGYDRGFSYGTGHDSAKEVTIGDEEYGGKGFGDKELVGYRLGGIGYGGLGYGGFRAPPPLIFFH